MNAWKYPGSYEQALNSKNYMHDAVIEIKSNSLHFQTKVKTDLVYKTKPRNEAQS